MLDMTESIAPRSDQANADDFMSGPRTFTITEVRKANNPEQPIDVVLAEFPKGRPFKPSKSMRRVMVAAWGPDASLYTGKRLTLYRDPTIRFGSEQVGGIRISHMSDIDKQMTLALTVTRGKRAPYIVKPLAADAPVAKPASPELLAELEQMFVSRGIAEDVRLAGANHYTGGRATALEVLTEDEVRTVIAAVEKRPAIVVPETTAETLPDVPTEDPDEATGWQE